MHYAIEGITGFALFWIFSSQSIELSLSTAAEVAGQMGVSTSAISKIMERAK